MFTFYYITKRFFSKIRKYTFETVLIEQCAQFLPKTFDLLFIIQNQKVIFILFGHQHIQLDPKQRWMYFQINCPSKRLTKRVHKIYLLDLPYMSCTGLFIHPLVKHLSMRVRKEFRKKIMNILANNLQLIYPEKMLTGIRYVAHYTHLFRQYLTFYHTSFVCI